YITGEWVFQQGDGRTTPPPKNFNKWITGDAPTDDSKGTCAYSEYGLWYPTTCDKEYVVICQKHMYDRHNIPSNLGDDGLSPGNYYLVVQTDFLASDTGCDVEIRVQSDLNIEFGFVDGMRKDAPHPIANVDSNENRVVSSVSIGKANSQNCMLQHVQLRSDDASSTLLEAATYSYRLGCGYDFVSQPLSCDLTNDKDFSVVMIGEDDTGNTFQRYSTSLCSKWYICENGGAYWNGQCLCPDYYTGDKCERVMCQNGGELSMSGDKCKCPSGFGGEVCQSVHCDANSETSFSNDGKALVLVLEKSETTADAIKTIGKTIHTIVQSLNDQHQGWIDKYMVLTFTLDGTIGDLAVYDDVNQFAKSLLRIADDAWAYNGDCRMPIWKALDHLFDFPSSEYLRGSELLIVSAASPNDADMASIHATMEKFDIQTPIVDFLHLDSVKCNVNDWIKELGEFTNFLSTTGGMIFRVDSEFVGLGMNSFLPTRYASQLLSYSDPLNCTDNEIFIQVDTDMAIVFIMVGGQGAKMEIETPKKKDPITTFQWWNSDEQSLWSMYPKYPGIYKITVNSKGSMCSPVVYGSVGAIAEGNPHAAQVFSGFIQSYNYLNTPKPYAVYGAVNFPVFHILEQQDAQTPPETLFMAIMTRKSIEGSNEESYTSDVDLRDGCSYTYMGKAFTCVAENDVITLSV
ncbi:hypothetical protein PENTCL1PPCAC_16685, partial [Pristionchus entomophagus]